MDLAVGSRRGNAGLDRIALGRRDADITHHLV